MRAPDRSQDITARWLTEVLATYADGSAVTGFELSDIGEGAGIFGEIVRVSLEYGSGAGRTLPSMR